MTRRPSITRKRIAAMQRAIEPLRARVIGTPRADAAHLFKLDAQQKTDLRTLIAYVDQLAAFYAEQHAAPTQHQQQQQPST